jgi:tRNA threonylcarbamoyladenosine biosynthesis protein TsaE
MVTPSLRRLGFPSGIPVAFIFQEICVRYKNMKQGFITKNSKETKRLGEILAGEIKNGQIVCLAGELGSGKTTFTQGLLKGLKIKGPYTSPTFVIMKKYKSHIFHLDAYRVNSQDILNLGWEEIISNNKNVVIIEWADKVRDIIPKDAIWIEFFWLGEQERKITFSDYKSNK